MASLGSRNTASILDLLDMATKSFISYSPLISIYFRKADKLLKYVLQYLCQLRKYMLVKSGVLDPPNQTFPVPTKLFLSGKIVVFDTTPLNSNQTEEGGRE